MLIYSAARNDALKTKGGGVVIIGFIPIIFGTDKKSTKLLLGLSIVLVALLIVFFLVQV